MPLDDALRERLEILVHNVNQERFLTPLGLETLVAEPFGTDIPEGAVGLKITYADEPGRFERGRWGRFLDDVEGRFSTLDLAIDLGRSKRVEGPPAAATWVLMPATFRSRR